MRVVAGKYKGRPLKSLKGEATRPTTMRVKESLFSALTSALGSFEGLSVLDMFAGSGALGIEALSRGAERVVFFEKSRQAARIVSDNLRTFGISDDEYQVVIGDAAKLALRTQSSPFDLILLDPPYAFAPETVFGLVEALESAGSLHADALICYELAKINEPAAIAGIAGLEWEIVAAKNFGDTSYIIARKGN